MPDPAAPILWQFSLSTVNAIIWFVMLALALWMGLRMRWGKLLAVTAFLTLDLIAFGAFVRLTDSGLGCPDWPGCYGQMLPATATTQINAAIAEQGGTHGPVSHSKAWIEMVHRYVASFIGALILVMFVRALVARFTRARFLLDQTVAPVGWGWPLLLLIVVSAQGLFGKWTVTLKLMPIVVTTHLMGGMLLFGLLIWFWMIERARVGDPKARVVAVTSGVRVAVWCALLAVTAQIFLGGWVSTNYAVLACGDFPACNGSYAPVLAWSEGFTWMRALGRNPDGTFLSIEALRAIHWAHRLGAIVVTVAVVVAALRLMRADASLKPHALFIKVILLAQIAVGISTVLWAQPLLLATAHNALAAILLASLLSAAFRVRSGASR